MDFHGDLAHSEFGSNLLVEETAGYPRHNFLLAMREVVRSIHQRDVRKGLREISDEALSKMDYYVEGVQGKLPVSK